MAEFDRARVPIHMPKGMFGLISGFPFILPKKTTITRAQQAVKIPIAIASVQVTRISMRESVSQKRFELRRVAFFSSCDVAEILQSESRKAKLRKS